MSCLSREVNSNSELSVLPTNRFFQVFKFIRTKQHGISAVGAITCSSEATCLLVSAWICVGSFLGRLALCPNLCGELCLHVLCFVIR